MVVHQGILFSRASTKPYGVGQTDGLKCGRKRGVSLYSFIKRDHCTALRAMQHPSMTPTSLLGCGVVSERKRERVFIFCGFVKRSMQMEGDRR